MHEAMLQAISATGGAVRFDRFMQMALYHPAFGYYTTRPAVLGPQGDFTTASEISPVYGATLARGIGADLAALEHPRVIEFGAGSGAFAVALMSALAGSVAGPRALPEEYIICEVSPVLRRLQAEQIAASLPTFVGRFRWLSPAEIPSGPGVVVANELIDALPVRRFVWYPDRLEELWVAAKDGAFAWRARAVTTATEAALRQHYGRVWASLSEGTILDVNARIPALLAQLKRMLSIGTVWLADYGETRSEYFHPERTEGTLVCHWQHQTVHDPLARVGEQDITASVDFTRVAEAASAAGLQVAGFATQAHALMMLGVDAVVAGLPDPADQLDAVAALKTLLLPGQMGERVKLMLLATPNHHSRADFGPFDMRHRL